MCGTNQASSTNPSHLPSASCHPAEQGQFAELLSETQMKTPTLATWVTIDKCISLGRCVARAIWGIYIGTPFPRLHRPWFGLVAHYFYSKWIRYWQGREGIGKGENTRRTKTEIRMQSLNDEMNRQGLGSETKPVRIFIWTLQLSLPCRKIFFSKTFIFKKPEDCAWK